MSNKVAGNVEVLPSLRSPTRSFSLRFSELRTFAYVPDFDIHCTNQIRKVNVSRLKGIFEDVGVVRRMASYWSREKANGGWDGS